VEQNRTKLIQTEKNQESLLLNFGLHRTTGINATTIDPIKVLNKPFFEQKPFKQLKVDYEL
jgi:hypothetical protein